MLKRVLTAAKSLAVLAALGALAVLSGAPPLAAQNPAGLSPKEKTEVFIQHLVKVAKIDPARYRALVLEYEIGTALSEMAHEGHEGEEQDASKACCGASAVAGVPATGDFIRSALKELHPAYAQALKLKDEEKLAEAGEAARDLAAKVDPYLAAHAALLLAEVDHAAAARAQDPADSKAACEHVISLCERIGQRDRLYLADDHRACELIALSFAKLGKPLHELVQYLILLTDYYDLPPEVERRARERLAALDGENGKPLGTVASWMNKVEKLLGKEVTGKDPTQAQQTEVVSALDKLIELQEARERRT